MTDHGSTQFDSHESIRVRCGVGSILIHGVEKLRLRSLRAQVHSVLRTSVYILLPGAILLLIALGSFFVSDQQSLNSASVDQLTFPLTHEQHKAQTEYKLVLLRNHEVKLQGTDDLATGFVTVEWDELLNRATVAVQFACESNQVIGLDDEFCSMLNRSEIVYRFAGAMLSGGILQWSTRGYSDDLGMAMAITEPLLPGNYTVDIFINFGSGSREGLDSYNRVLGIPMIMDYGVHLPSRQKTGNGVGDYFGHLFGHTEEPLGNAPPTDLIARITHPQFSGPKAKNCTVDGSHAHWRFLDKKPPENLAVLHHEFGGSNDIDTQYVWAGEDCNMSRYTPQELRYIWKDRWFHMVGDSVSRGMFCDIVTLFSTGVEHMMREVTGSCEFEHPQSKIVGRPSAKHSPKEYKLDLSEDGQWGNITFTFTFIKGIYNHDGNCGKLQRRPSLDMALDVLNVKEQFAPDVYTFKTGRWDYRFGCSDLNCAGELYTNFIKLWTALEDRFAAIDKKVIKYFETNTASFAGAIAGPAHHPDHDLPSAYWRYQNTLLHPFRLLDIPENKYVMEFLKEPFECGYVPGTENLEKFHDMVKPLVRNSGFIWFDRILSTMPRYDLSRDGAHFYASDGFDPFFGVVSRIDAMRLVYDATDRFVQEAKSMTPEPTPDSSSKMPPGQN
eukprot:Clim_evm29s151 gene=Clim_evmTU29s151